MSFVTTRPEALMAAASMLEALGSSMDAQTRRGAHHEHRPGGGRRSVRAAGRAVFRLRRLVSAGQRPGEGDPPDDGQQPGHQRRFLWRDRNRESGDDRRLVAVAACRLTDCGGRPPPAGSTTLGTGIGWGQNVGAAASDFITLGEGQFAPVTGAAGIPNFTPGLTSASAPAPAAPPQSVPRRCWRAWAAGPRSARCRCRPAGRPAVSRR